MPSDSYYDEMDAIDDKVKDEYKNKLITKLNKLTLEEKVEFLIDDYINTRR